MLGSFRVLCDIDITMFSNLTIGMLIGSLMCVFFIVQCSKKKPEKNMPSQSHLLDQSIANKSAKKKRSKDKSSIPKKPSGENLQKSEKKEKSVENEVVAKNKSKIGKSSKKIEKRSDKSTSSKTKQSGQSKPMDGTQNGPTPHEPTTIDGSEKKEDENKNVNWDDIDKAMDVTIDDPETPAVHERVTRVFATDLIFDPKVVTYKGNVDEDGDPAEEAKLANELDEACKKHEARFKDLRRNEEKNPNYKRPKSTESEKSIDKKPPPPDLRVKMKPEKCILYETKEQWTEDEDLDKAEDGENKQQ